MPLSPLRCDFITLLSRESAYLSAGKQCQNKKGRCKKGIFVRPTSHVGVRLKAMRKTVNDVSSHLCNILTQIMARTYLQTGQRLHRITRCPVVTCYNSVKPPETSNASIYVQNAFVFRWTRKHNVFQVKTRGHLSASWVAL